MSLARGLPPLLGLLLITLTCTAASTASPVNDTQQHFTATAKPVPAGNQEALLKWALAHSDPEGLRRAAADARADIDAGSSDFLERRQQLLDAMAGGPSEHELLVEAVAILNNASATHSQLNAALVALRQLVEPIDFANNLHGMGGVAPLVALLSAGQPADLQAKAAHALGTAASNNHKFQEQLMEAHPEVLPRLLRLLPGGISGGKQVDEEESEAGAKALYCLSTIVRLSRSARAAFYRSAGLPALQRLLGSGGGDARLKRKALGLLTDLVALDSTAAIGEAGGAASEAAVEGHLREASLDYFGAVSAALELLDAESEGLEPDFDLHEKALLALQALLESSSNPSAAAAAAAFTQSGGEAVLLRLQSGLQTAAAEADEEGGEYLGEIQKLAAQVAARALSAGGGVHSEL